MRPSLLRNTIRAKGINEGVVVIDKIQRLPDLLNEVHMLIEETDIHFLLTGSSARKLKRKSVNLLGEEPGGSISIPSYGLKSRLLIHPLPTYSNQAFYLQLFVVKTLKAFSLIMSDSM